MKKQSKNDGDIIAFMTKIQAQLAVLDRKFDTFMTKSLNELAEARAAQKTALTVPAAPRPNDQRSGRPMFKATCADCKKECELPFRPSGDRPVYCQECFARRKATRTLHGNAEPKPQEAPPVQTVINAAAHVPEPGVKKAKKPAARKPAGKKKAGAKKKK